MHMTAKVYSRKVKWIVILLLGVYTNGWSNIKSDIFTDSLPKVTPKKFTPFIEYLSVNAAQNRINFWIRKQDWADVNPTVWKRNLKTGFQTDGDRFSTNFLGHPINGSWYYNIARSSGYNYWQSAPQALFGSLIWEFFCENEPASEIDINTTSFGGIHLGEMTHRLSTFLLANHKNRRFKTARALGSLVLDPMGSINGLMFADVKNYRQDKSHGGFPVRSFLSVGANLPYALNDDLYLPKRAHVKYHLIYGDLFSKTTIFRPFDFFVVQAWVDIAPDDEKNRLLPNITSNASVARFSISDNFLLGISQHYDFMNNHIFDQGDVAITTDLTYKMQTNNVRMIATLKGGVVLFGSTSSDIIPYLKSIGQIENNRNYVYGNGFTIESQVLLDFKKLGVISLNNNSWFLFNRSDIKGTENSQITTFTYSIPIANNHSLLSEYYNYNRQSHYNANGFTDAKKGYSEFRLGIRYAF